MNSKNIYRVLWIFIVIGIVYSLYKYYFIPRFAIPKEIEVYMLSDEGKKLYSLSKKYLITKGWIVQVYDGDTVRLANSTKIRYLGVNTPEMGLDYDKIIEPGAEKATNLNKTLVDNKKVILFIPRKKEFSYDRLLAYVYTPVKKDGKKYYLNVSMDLIKKNLGNSKYGKLDEELPYKIWDLQTLRKLIE